MKKNQIKIDWKRLLKKAAEDGIKKGIELSIVAVALGMAYKFIFVTVPAVTLAAIAAKLFKVRFLDQILRL